MAGLVRGHGEGFWQCVQAVQRTADQRIKLYATVSRQRHRGLEQRTGEDGGKGEADAAEPERAVWQYGGVAIKGQADHPGLVTRHLRRLHQGRVAGQAARNRPARAFEYDVRAASAGEFQYGGNRVFRTGVDYRVRPEPQRQIERFLPTADGYRTSSPRGPDSLKAAEPHGAEADNDRGVIERRGCGMRGGHAIC